ncbi:MAG: PAS domain-containing protein [Nitrospinae bacterium]|nr:PAS domain-containing protein [Nitrospinota bacterium]
MRGFPFPMRVTIPLALFVLVLVSGFVEYQLAMYEAGIKMDKDVKNEAMLRGSRLAFIVERLYLHNDFEGVQTAIAFEASDPSLNHISLVDEHDVTLISTRLEMVGKHAISEWGALGKGLSEEGRRFNAGQFNITGDGMVAATSFPVNIGNTEKELRAKHVGMLYMEYSLQPRIDAAHYEGLQRFKRDITSIGFICLGVAVFFAWIVTARVRVLEEASERIAEGDFKAPIELSGSDELATVAAAFNRMVMKLKENMDSFAESESRFRAMADSAPMLVWTAPQEPSQRDYFNKTWYIFTGLSPQNSHGGRWLMAVHPEDAPKLQKIFENAAMTLKPWQAEFRIKRKDGKYRWILERGVPRLFPTGGFAGYIGSSLDVTEMRNAQETAKLHAHRLELVNKEMEEFTYAASHDMQEPLRTITSFCSFLKKDLEDNNSVKITADVNFIVDAAKRMKQLIDDLLQLSRAGRIELKSQELNLESLAQKVIVDLRSRIDETGGTVIVEKMPNVMGDPMFISRVLQNLIANSLKYRGQNPPIVKISAIANGDDTEITVEDNGIGIRQEYIEQIFLPFKKLHPVAQYGGTGLGLSISRKIIERHEGRIWAESEVGKGSKFKFTLKSV